MSLVFHKYQVRVQSSAQVSSIGCSSQQISREDGGVWQMSREDCRGQQANRAENTAAVSVLIRLIPPQTQVEYVAQA